MNSISRTLSSNSSNRIISGENIAAFHEPSSPIENKQAKRQVLATNDDSTPLSSPLKNKYDLEDDIMFNPPHIKRQSLAKRREVQDWQMKSLDNDNNNNNDNHEKPRKDEKNRGRNDIHVHVSTPVDEMRHSTFSPVDTKRTSITKRKHRFFASIFSKFGQQSTRGATINEK